MSTLNSRLVALELSQDCKCAACWNAFIAALVVYRGALVRQGVPFHAAVAHICKMDALWADVSDEQRQQLDAAIPHAQVELDAANAAYDRVEHMSPACAGWWAREHAKGVL